MEPSKRVYGKSAVIPSVILAVISLLGALLLTHFPQPVRASSGPAFVGFYRTSNADVIGSQVRLAFSARIFNHTRYDVTSATVTLAGPGAPDGTYATFNSVSLADKANVFLTQEINIPQGEYDKWHKGEKPLLFIVYVDQSGMSQRQAVELRPGAVGRN